MLRLASEICKTKTPKGLDLPLSRMVLLSKALFQALFLTPLGRVGEDKSSQMLSFFLEFWVFSLSFENFSWVFGKILFFFQKNLNILTNNGIFYHFFLFLKIFVNKNGVKSATPLKILSFDEKVSWNLVFSWVLHMGGKVLPKVEFFLEFCPWVLHSFFGGWC